MRHQIPPKMRPNIRPTQKSQIDLINYKPPLLPNPNVRNEPQSTTMMPIIQIPVDSPTGARKPLTIEDKVDKILRILTSIQAENKTLHNDMVNLRAERAALIEDNLNLRLELAANKAANDTKFDMLMPLIINKESPVNTDMSMSEETENNEEQRQPAKRKRSRGQEITLSTNEKGIKTSTKLDKKGLENTRVEWGEYYSIDNNTDILDQIGEDRELMRKYSRAVFARVKDVEQGKDPKYGTRDTLYSNNDLINQWYKERSLKRPTN